MVSVVAEKQRIKVPASNVAIEISCNLLFVNAVKLADWDRVEQFTDFGVIYELEFGQLRCLEVLTAFPCL